jgi:hypothetical protein
MGETKIGPDDRITRCSMEVEMGRSDQINEEFADSVSDVFEEGYVVGHKAAYGIGQRIIHQGLDSLTPKQRTIFDAVISPAMRRRYSYLERQRNMELVRYD